MLCLCFKKIGQEHVTHVPALYKKGQIMKKILFFKIWALIIALTCNTSFIMGAKTMTQTPSSSQSYSCGAVYPTQVNCPAGQTCVFPGPTCIMNINAVGGSSITEELYNLGILPSEIVTLALNQNINTKLPISAYPELGKRIAYEFKAASGDYANIPFRIVIKTELPNDAFINTLANGINRLTDTTKKEAANTLLSTLQSYKELGKPINIIYRSIPALGETQYKLQHVRVPGTNSAEALIMVTPKGNLQFYEKSDKTGETNVIEIDTGALAK